MSWVDEFGDAWARRLVADATFATLIGADAHGTRVRREWPHSLLERPAASNATPLLTWFVATPVRLSMEPEKARIQTDLWVFPPNDGTGPTIRANLDSRALEVFGVESPVAWYDTTLDQWLSAVWVDASDPQEDRFLRRRRDWEVAPA